MSKVISKTKTDCKQLYRNCYDAVKDKMGKWPGGDGDGVFFFFPRRFEVEINHKEPFMERYEKSERVLGVFYTYNRICAADQLIVDRPEGIFCHMMPRLRIDLLTQLLDNIERLKFKNSLMPVVLKQTGPDEFCIPKGLSSTRFVKCKFERMATVAMEMSRCRVYH